MKVSFERFTQPTQLKLSRTFSTYGDSNVMAVERYIMQGLSTVSDNQIKYGFPVISSQLMSYNGYVFNNIQQERLDTVQRRFMKL